MTRELIEMRLKHIAQVARDGETAHSEEDSLYRDFLSWIALDAPEPYASLAALVLTAMDIDFVRHYA